MSLINKPLVVEKFKSFHNYVKNNDGKIGTKQRGIDLNLNNACNLRCKYCFTNSPKGDHVKEYLDYDAIAKLADEADELGYFEFDLQGGELLLQPKKLFKVLEAIKPENYPKLIVMEDGINSRWERDILSWLLANGYEIKARTRGNVMLASTK